MSIAERLDQAQSEHAGEILGRALQSGEDLAAVKEAGFTPEDFPGELGQIAARLWERDFEPGDVPLAAVAEVALAHELVDRAPLATSLPRVIRDLKTNRASRRALVAVTQAIAANTIARPHEVLKNMAKLRAVLEDIEAEADPQDEHPLMRLSDLEAYTLDPEDWIAGNGWIRRGAFTLITGPTGLGKSVLVEQIAVSIASGIPILARIKLHQPAKVSLLTAENDIETLQRDIRAVIQGTDADRELVEANLTIRHIPTLTGRAFTAYAVARMKAERPDVLIIDNFQSFSGADINDSGQWNDFIAPLKAAAARYGVALVLVDHTTKPKQDQNSRTARESVYAAAGTSLKANAARTSAELSECKDDERRFRLRFGKNAERTGLMDERGRTLRDLFIEHSDSAHRPYWRISPDQTPEGGEYDAAIAAAVEEHPDWSARKIADAVGANHTTVLRARKRMKI